MMFIYLFGLSIGMQLGRVIERSISPNYHHIEKINKLEYKIKEYEHLINKNNYK